MAVPEQIHTRRTERGERRKRRRREKTAEKASRRGRGTRAPPAKETPRVSLQSSLRVWTKAANRSPRCLAGGWACQAEDGAQTSPAHATLPCGRPQPLPGEAAQCAEGRQGAGEVRVDRCAASAYRDSHQGRAQPWPIQGGVSAHVGRGGVAHHRPGESATLYSAALPCALTQGGLPRRRHCTSTIRSA